MRNYKIQLKEQGYSVQGGTLECILMDRPFDSGFEGWKRPAVIVVPGGGYGFVSKREGEPVANYFLANGFQAVVLTYLVSGDGVSYPEQLIEIASAVDFVKKHAEEYNVNPDEVFVVGFSAGGHLVGNLATQYMEAPVLAGQSLDCKPTAAGLSYPVVYPEGHMGSYVNLLQGYDGEEKERLMKKLTLDKAVTKDTVPSFLWSTAGDGLVPPQNALRYAMACAENGVLFEIHVYPQGGHGGATADWEVNGQEQFLRKIHAWLENCASFFRLFVKETF